MASVSSHIYIPVKAPFQAEVMITAQKFVNILINFKK